MDYFVDLNFSREKRSILAKHLHVMYFFGGAFFFDSYVRLWFKCYSIVHVCLAYAFCTIPPLREMIADSKLHDVIHSVGFLFFIHTAVANMCLIFWKRSEFHQLLRLVDEHTNDPIPLIEASKRDVGYLKETNIMNICLRIYQCSFLYYVVIYLSKISLAFLSDDVAVDQPNKESEFLIPYFCENCNTTLSYALAYNLSSAFVLPFSLTYDGTLLLFLVLSIHLRNRAIVLQNDIHYYSEAARERFESHDKLTEEELQKSNPSKFKLREIVRQRENEARQFTNRVQNWIRIHQRLFKCMNQYHKCAKNLIDLLIGVSLTAGTVLAYIVSSYVLDSNDFQYQYFFHCMQHFMRFSICCAIGNVFDDVSAMLSDAIYSTPWYYLPVKEQKVILIFLALAQRIQKLRVFRVFSLNLEFMPRRLNDTYGYIQIMRLLVTRSKK